MGAGYGDRVLVLPLDVTDAGQVQNAVRTAEERFGGVDVLVNNAGRGWYGSIEGQDDAAVRAMFELNFFALLAVIRAALPGMRARGSGWILNMSSVAGLRGVTGFGHYSATKFAVEAVTDVLREEVSPLGIRVLAVEPGAFRTRAYAGFADEPIAESIADYRPMLEQVRTAMIEQDGRQPGDPQRGVRAVIAAMAQDPPPRGWSWAAAGSTPSSRRSKTRSPRSAPARRCPAAPTSRPADQHLLTSRQVRYAIYCRW